MHYIGKIYLNKKTKAEGVKHMKKIINAIFFPHLAIVALITVLSSILLAYSLIALPHLHRVSVFSYIFSAYALTLVICAFPYLISRTKKLFLQKRKNIQKNDSEQIAQLKINIALYGTFFYNSIYAAFTLSLGAWYRSSWYLSIAAYYILLAIMRFSLLCYSRSNKAGEDMLSELNRFKICGALLLVMNTALSAMTFFMTLESRDLPHNTAITVTLAVFTVSLLAISIINIIKYRKYNSPIFFAAKLISFSASLVTMLSLGTAIISKYGNIISNNAQKLITRVSALSVLSIIGAIGIFMVIRGNKEIKKLKLQKNPKKYKENAKKS